MFDKNGFMRFMQDNFYLNGFSISLLISLVEYGEDRFATRKETVYFLWDILSKAEIFINFDEIDQFYYE